jgi:hypothetical protein
MSITYNEQLKQIDQQIMMLDIAPEFYQWTFGILSEALVTKK